MSELKVNKISPRSGTGVALGDSGDTFTLPSGGTIAIAAGATINNQGTAVNFGATGSASWVTTVKTSTFTAVAGEGYFVNTTGGVVTVNLPAGVAGAVVAIKDYAGTFDTNKVTLVQNGSDKIGGSTVNATLETEGIAVTLVFIDSTQGWLVTDSGLQDEAPTAQYITATGGTITCSGNFRIHTFTGPGAFCVSSAGNPAGSTEVSYIVLAGGASGGSSNGGGGGGGAGGYREGKCSSDPYTASPLAATGLPVSVQSYPIVVGGGGPPASPPGSGVGIQGNAGSNSSFSTIIATGGGGGGGDICNSTNPGVAGGSGGGGGKGPYCSGGAPGGAGNTPPVSPSQGNNGGTGGAPNTNYGGGGGGAGAVGGNGNAPLGGPGGVGATSSINGTPTGRAGGGGGQAEGQPIPAQGQATCGGARGNQTNNPGIAATVNTGGGGGGTDSAPSTAPTGAGGSGIVVIRYKFQN